jgi:hypothetical protein
VSDVFHEVDEEVRREQLKKLWDRYSVYVIAAAVLLVAAVGAWRGYSWWEARRAAEAGAAFEVASNLAEAGKHAEAEAAFDKIAGDATSTYRQLARLRAAAELAQTDQKAALAAYESIAADGAVNALLREVAALRAAALLIDVGSLEEARAKLEPLAGSERPFHHTARELLVLAAWRAGNAAEAKRWADVVITDAQTPGNVRLRVERLIALGPAGSKG